MFTAADWNGDAAIWNGDTASAWNGDTVFPGQQSVLTIGVQQNGMTTAPPQTGMGTEHQYTVYSTNPRQYTATHEVHNIDVPSLVRA